MTALILANTQRTIGWVIASIVLVGMGTYILFSFRIGKREVGSEIDLAPNRVPHADDDELETRFLDRNLAWSLVTLTIVSLILPLYWLMEPARQDNAARDWVSRFETRGPETSRRPASAATVRAEPVVSPRTRSPTWTAGSWPRSSGRRRR